MVAFLLKIYLITMFTFSDIFAGIGGFHYALSSLRGKCLYACEKDKHAQKAYEDNHHLKPLEDVSTLDIESLPYVDLVCMGFPCQDLSSIGTRKGLEKGTRSHLVFDALKIVEKKKPKVFIAENVKGLLSHNQGETFIFLKTYMESLAYDVYYQTLNSLDYGLPQNRERVFMIGIRKDLNKTFVFPKQQKRIKSVAKFLEQNVDEKYHLSEKLLKNYIYKKDDGRPYVVDQNSTHTKTLNSSYHKIQRLTGTFVKLDDYYLRKLTPREILNFQGFPKIHRITVSDTQAYRQAGNAVSVPVIKALGKALLEQSIL